MQLKLEATGTRWVIDFELIDKSKEEIIAFQIEKLIWDFEQKYSRFKEDSLMSKLKNNTGIFFVGEEFVEILEIYFQFFNATKGKFTPLVGITLEDLGYDKDYSFNHKEQRIVPNLKETIKILSKDKIEITKPISFDFGGLGKGFLIKKISKYFDSLSTSQVLNYLIDGGGDIYFKSNTDTKACIKIGLENPNTPEEVVGIMELGSGNSICGSSNNRRNWNGNTHIVGSQYAILSTWCVSPDAVLADGLATCLFLEDVQSLSNFLNFDYLILKNDMSAEYSNKFRNSLFD